MKRVIFLCAFLVTYKCEAMNKCTYPETAIPLVLQKAEEIYYKNLPWLFPTLYSFQVKNVEHNTNLQSVAQQIVPPHQGTRGDDYKNDQGLFCEEVELERVKEIVAKGGNLDVQDKQGNTPLMRAAINFWIPVVKFLLEHNADISCKNHANYSFENLLEEPSEPNGLFVKKCIYQILYQNALKKKSPGMKVIFTKEKQ